MIDTILEGDCLELLPSLPDDSIDAIVTDPPYELTSGNSKKGFMGKAWDGSGIAYDVGMWAECLRVLKPGGHMLAFGGDRTHHRMFCAIEDAGFEIRHTVVWTYGSGFPKSLDISKKLDQMAGAEREDLGPNPNAIGRTYDIRSGNLVQSPNKVIREDICRVTAPATPAAKQWAGFGSALKPAAEFICLARKPLAESTIAANVLRWGCGGLNIDGCRVGTRTENESGWSKTGSKASENRSMTGANYERAPKDEIGLGRFPANLIWSHSPNCKRIGESWDCDPSCPSWQFAKAGERLPGRDGNNSITKTKSVFSDGRQPEVVKYRDSGSAARFFQSCPFTEEDIPAFLYYAKASKSERNLGCSSLPLVAAGGYEGRNDGSLGKITYNNNNHPTVKPLALMRYLCRLITPPCGLILDPFAGSGTTCLAAKQEGFRFIGIEKEPEYAEIARRRVASVDLIMHKPLTAFS